MPKGILTCQVKNSLFGFFFKGKNGVIPEIAGNCPPCKARATFHVRPPREFHGIEFLTTDAVEGKAPVTKLHPARMQ